MSSNKSRNLLRVALLIALALIICLVSGCSKTDKPAETAAAVEQKAAEAVDTAKEAVEDAAAAVGEKAGEAVETAKEAVEDAAAVVEEKAGEAVETAKEAVEDAAAAVEEKAGEAVETAREAVEDTAAAVEEKAGEAAETAEAADASAEAAAEATEAPAAEPVLLVTVNGKEIKSDDEYLQNVISYYMDYAASYGYDTTDPSMVSMINQYSLQYTMRTILIRQKAAELGLDQLTDEEKAEIDAKMKAEWEETIQQYISQYYPLGEDATDEEKANARAAAEAALLEYGYDEARFVSEFSESEIDNLITVRLQDYLTEGKTVSEEDVQKYFDDLVAADQENYGKDIGTYEFYTTYYGQNSYYVPDGYRAVTHILLKVDDELLNTWKDLSARLEEQKSAEEEEPTEEEATEETPAEEPSVEPAEEAAAAEETPAPEESPAAEEEAEPTEEPTPTPEPVTQEMVDAAEKAILDSVQSTVDEIKAKLEGGASFEDMIKEYGTDPGMQDDATRAAGYSVHKDSIMWDPAFTAAAMALENVGDISDPVVGQYGVHILQYLKDIPGGAVELTEEMKEEFRNTLLGDMKTEALNTALDQWMAEADIVYTEEGEAWKVTEAEPEEETEEASAEATEDPAAEEPAAEVAAPAEPAAEALAAEESPNP